MGNVDIQVAFYAMELRAELLMFFGLPYDVRAGDVGIKMADGHAVPPGQRIAPVFAVIATSPSPSPGFADTTTSVAVWDKTRAVLPFSVTVELSPPPRIFTPVMVTSVPVTPALGLTESMRL